jgi:hypothetical protein
MKNRRFSRGLTERRQRPAIKTTFMELIREITNLTKDDALVLEVVKRIFASHRVRLTRTLAPVRLTNDNISRHARRRHGFTRSTAWA